MSMEILGGHEEVKRATFSVAKVAASGDVDEFDKVLSSASSSTESAPCSEVEDSRMSSDELELSEPVRVAQPELPGEEERKPRDTNQLESIVQPDTEKGASINEIEAEHIRHTDLTRAKLESCPLGHGLGEFLTPSSTYYCDGCGTAQSSSSILYGCRLCNFDLCTECVNPSVVEQATKQVRCSEGHGLIDMRWKGSRICYGCRRRLEPEMERFLSCAACDYDFCGKCCGIKQPTHYEVLGVEEDATTEQIQQAAWVRSLEYRREVVKNPRLEHCRADAIMRFNEVAVAQAILSDPDSRALYNQQLNGSTVEVESVETHSGDGNRRTSMNWWVKPPGAKRRPDSQPSLMHGTYLMTVGTLYAPVASTVMVAVSVGAGVVLGTACVGRGVVRGVDGVTMGIRQVINKKKAKGRSVKVFVKETQAYQERLARVSATSGARPLRNFSRGVTEPLYGVLGGTCLLLGCTLAGVSTAVEWSILGAAGNFCDGWNEMKQAL